MVGISSTIPMNMLLLNAGALKPAQQKNLLSGGALSQEQDLSPEEKQQVQELKARDQEVRAHEQAHATIGGPYAGQPTYEYQEGPDGRRYAVGGEVAIDASPVAGNPDATIRKMDIVIRAALAPAEPSPQDRQVAQQAQATRLQAQIEKREAQESEQSKNGDSRNASSTSLSNPFQALIDAAIEQSKQDTDKPNNQKAQSGLLSLAISGYTRASNLA